MPDTALRIISLQTSNVKKVTAVQITPQGNVVTLTGPNGAGKSSVLDAIWYALAGKDAMCEQPLRKGANKSETILKIGNAQGAVELIATRRITPTGTTISLTDAKGALQTSPQTLLDKLVGNLAFDPIEFVRMKQAPRLETLRKLVGLDFATQDAQRAKLYNERTLINRDADNAKGTLNTIPLTETAPKEEVSVTALVAQLSELEETNNQNTRMRTQLETLKSVSVNAQQAEERAIAAFNLAKQSMEDAKGNRVESTRTLIAQQQKVSALVDADPAPLRQKIADAGTINRQVQDNARHAKAKSALVELEKKSFDLTAEIKKIDDAKADAMAKAKFPLPGLSFDDGSVLLDGLPFEQASTGAQFRASVAVGMALNPKLHVIFIRDGSLIDDAGLKLIGEMAQQNDYQVWIEAVRSDDPTAIVIEDGHVKEQPTEQELSAH